MEVNCAAIPRDLVESELFGHEKGSFTGADRQRVGKFELADGGTLFLDEIGDMTEEAQAKVLRAVEENKFQRVGGADTKSVDVRIIAATNRDLSSPGSGFRQDLFFRLNVVNLHVPQLRERREDILPLARFFLDRYAVDFKKRVTGFSPEAINKLRQYPWPGNVRELQNAVERAVLLCEEEIIDTSHLTMEGQFGEGDALHGDTLNLEQLERAGIIRALQATRGVQKEAANLLGISPRVLNYKIQLLHIDWKVYRSSVM